MALYVVVFILPVLYAILFAISQKYFAVPPNDTPSTIRDMFTRRNTVKFLRRIIVGMVFFLAPFMVGRVGETILSDEVGRFVQFVCSLHISNMNALRSINFHPFQNAYSKKSNAPKRKEVWIQDHVWNLRGIYGIAVDNQGNIYCTSSSQVLWRLRKNETQAFALLQLPNSQLSGIVWNGDNLLYVCDSSNHNILAYSINNGNTTVIAGGKEGYVDGPTNEAKFCWPKGITIDVNGDLFITELNHIRKINLRTGIVETIAGSNYGYADGRALEAKFGKPSGISVDLDGTVFVCDALNNCIRAIAAGRAFTVAGTPRCRGSQDGSLYQSLFTEPIDLILRKDGIILVCDKGQAIRSVDLDSNRVSSVSICGIAKPTAFFQPDKDTLMIAVQEGLFKMGGVWLMERLLWIGCLKENSAYCGLAVLPRDTIREIAAFVRWNFYQ